MPAGRLVDRPRTPSRGKVPPGRLVDPTLRGRNGNVQGPQRTLSLEHRRGTEARSVDKCWLASQRTAHPLPRSNYEFNSNFSIRYWGWNYHGSWHQTCPSHGSSRKDLNWTHSN